MADDPKADYEARKKAQAEATEKYWATASAMTPTPTQEENDLAMLGMLPNGPAAAPDPAASSGRTVPRPAAHEPAHAAPQPQPHR